MTWRLLWSLDLWRIRPQICHKNMWQHELLFAVSLPQFYRGGNSREFFPWLFEKTFILLEILEPIINGLEGAGADFWICDESDTRFVSNGCPNFPPWLFVHNTEFLRRLSQGNTNRLWIARRVCTRCLFHLWRIRIRPQIRHKCCCNRTLTLTPKKRNFLNLPESQDKL